MALYKEDNLTVLDRELETSNLVETIGYMSDLFQSMYLKREDYLTPQEKLFFAACVIVANKGIKYSSTQGYRVFKDVFNVRRASDVRGYIVRLEEKKWLTSNKKTKKIEVNEFFKMDLSKQVVKIEMKLSYNG